MGGRNQKPKRDWAKYEPSGEPLGTSPNAIYVLVDPRDETVRYVGKARDFERRRRQHCNDDLAIEKNKHLLEWKKELRALGIAPSMRIVERCSESRWQAVERWWIRHYRSKGRLCNIQPGGLVRAVVNKQGNFVKWESASSYGQTAARVEHRRRKKKRRRKSVPIDPNADFYARNKRPDLGKGRDTSRPKKAFMSKIWKTLDKQERARSAALGRP